MLGYLILAAVQFAIAYFGAPALVGFLKLSLGGDVQNFVTAAVAAVIVWIVGVVGSLILKDVKMPASSTLVSTLVGALIGAALTLPFIKTHIPFNAQPACFWIVGGIIGYMVRR